VGQKINPIGLRIALNKNWESRWYADKASFGSNLHEDLKLRDYVKANFKNAAIARVVIERFASRIRLTAHVARPGVMIGRKGSELEKLRGELHKLTVGKDVFVDVVEVKKPETNAQLVAESIAMQLERRISFRRAMKKSIQTAMDMGVQGIKIKCAGRLGGAELARTEQYKDGKTPLHTLKANIDYGFVAAMTPAGKIGIKVWICHKESMEDMNNATNAKKGKAQKSSAR